VTGTTLASLWSEAVRERGPQPFLTHYDLSTGERVELSHVTADNWVSKTANLAADLGLAGGDRLAVDLPLHWQAAVWCLAAWRTGVCVAGGGETVVTTPEGAAHHAGSDLVVCSLRPLGLPCEDPLPAHAVDYALEVRSQADRHTGPPPSDDDPALEGATHAEALRDARADASALPPHPRLLVAEQDGHRDVVRPLLAALVTGGSLVLVRGADPDGGAIARVAADERVDLRLLRGSG